MHRVTDSCFALLCLMFSDKFSILSHKMKMFHILCSKYFGRLETVIKKRKIGRKSRKYVFFEVGFMEMPSSFEHIRGNFMYLIVTGLHYHFIEFCGLFLKFMSSLCSDDAFCVFLSIKTHFPVNWNRKADHLNGTQSQFCYQLLNGSEETNHWTNSERKTHIEHQWTSSR